MPTIDLLPAGSRGRRPAAVIAAIIVGIPAWLLGACGLMQEWPPPEAAGINARMVEPSPGPIASGPIVLAPSMTGAPVPPTTPPSPPATPVVAVAPTPPLSRPLPPPIIPVAAPPAPPAPAIPVAMPAPSPPPAIVDIPTFAPDPCPPGAIAVWSEPDAAGVPALICRRLGPPR
jgi:hypothetical protein